MLIQSYKLLLVFTLGLMKEMHISGQQIKYITAYRNSSEASMHCIQMRPAGTRDKKNLISYTQKKCTQRREWKPRKDIKWAFFCTVKMWQDSNLSAFMKVKSCFTIERKGFIFLFIKIQSERVKLCDNSKSCMLEQDIKSDSPERKELQVTPSFTATILYLLWTPNIRAYANAH